MAIDVMPIAGRDVGAVAQFLAAHLNSRVPAQVWEQAINVSWRVDAPNHGFLLREGDRVVGVYLAFYSQRAINGRPERFCNLGAWCVLPEYRFQSVRLLKALLAQGGYHFTDLSPSGNVVPLNTRLKFRFLDTSTALVPNLPWPSMPGRIRVSADPEVIAATLTGAELQLYQDHVTAAAARHLVVTDGKDSCYVVFRKDRRKNLPLFVSVLYVSNSELFHRATPLLTRHFLVHHRAAATFMETRVVGRRPRMSLPMRSSRPKMFRSTGLDGAQIDYLYSELTCVPW